MEYVKYHKDFQREERKLSKEFKIWRFFSRNSFIIKWKNFQPVNSWQKFLQERGRNWNSEGRSTWEHSSLRETKLWEIGSSITWKRVLIWLNFDASVGFSHFFYCMLAIFFSIKREGKSFHIKVRPWLNWNIAFCLINWSLDTIK